MTSRLMQRTALLLVVTLIVPMLLEIAVPVARAAEQQYTAYTSQDSFVRRTNPSSPVPDFSNMPYGGEAAKTGYLQVKESNTTSPRETYLQFDLSNYPENISSASLYFHANNDENDTTVDTAVYGIQAPAGSSWAESSLTWNNKPDKEESPLGMVAVPGKSNKGWVNLDVTSYVRDRLADDKIVSFAIAGGGALIRIESSTTFLNDSTGQKAKPYLVINGTPALKSVELTADKTSLGLGQTANLSVTGKLDTNGPADLTQAALHYSSDDPAVAFADPAVGVATAMAEGTADVTVQVTLDGVTRTSMQTLTVDGTPPAEATGVQAGIENGDYTLTWTDPTDEDFEFVNIYNEEQLLGSVPRGVQSLILTGFTDGQTYTLSIRTVDRAGNASPGVVHAIEYEQPLALATVVATVSERVVRAGQSVVVEATGVMSDGTAADLAEATILYASSSDSIVFADERENTAEAMRAGAAHITVQVTLDGVTRHSAPVLVRVLDGEQDEFDRLRNKYAAKFTGYDPDDPYDLADPDIGAYIQGQDDLARGYWDSLNKTAYGWDDLTSTTVSSQLATLTSRLRTMSRQWATYGSVYYQNESLLQDIIATWNTFYETRYNEGMTRYDNWFDWQVNVPNNFNDSISAIYEAVPYSDHPDLIRKMIRALDHFVPSVGLTGANRVYLSKVVILRGIIGKDGAKIREGSDGLSVVFPYVQEGDGFYEDGSFIQHSYFPYAGGYGKALLHDLSETLWLVSGSEWDNNDPQKSNLFEWYSDTFDPSMFKGHIIDAVNGREISRTSVYSGNTVLRGLLLQLELDGNPYVQQHKSAIQYHLEQGNANAFMSDSPIWYIQQAKTLMDDTATPTYAEPQGNYLFHHQDNVVHRGDGWLYSIGMHSERMANYESVNNENLKGWYQGDGMTQLYLDPNDYLSLFWITADPHRLPGITVDRDENRPPATSANRPYVDISKYQGDGELMDNDWTGGVSMDGLYGTAGMDFRQHHYSNMDVSAKKSWFMFDDEVVALGAGINSTSSREIETIVENRVLNSQGDNALTVDGAVHPSPRGQQELLADTGWIHLDGTGGYVFPGGADINMLKEERAGKAQDINQRFYYPGYDSFNSTIRSSFWGFVRENSANYAFTGSKLNIVTQQGSLAGSANNTRNLLQTAAPVEDFYISTALDFHPSEQGQEAGIMMRKDDDNYVYVSVGAGTEGRRIMAASEIAGELAVAAYPAPSGGEIYLTIDKSGDRYDVYASADEADRGEPLHSFTNPMAGDRMNEGLKMGLFAQNGTDETAGTTASFDYFHILHTRNYMTLWVDHGIDPVDESYQYIVLPKKESAEVAAYNDNPDVAVLANTKQLQAVRESRLGMTAMNFWERGAFEDVKANQPSSVMLRENGSELKAAVSDPTQKRDVISFEIKRTGTAVVSKDSTVTVLQLSPTIRFEVDASADPGATHEVVFAFDGEAEAADFAEPALKALRYERSYLVADAGETTAPALTAILDDDGTANEDDYTVVYYSSNDAAAVVDEEGVITAIAPGTAAITAVATMDGVSRSASLEVLVASSAPATTRLYPTKDTFVRGGIYENDIYGAESKLYVKNADGDDYRESYFSFDLGAVEGEIESVKLYATGRIDETSGTFVDTVLRPIAGSWDETSTSYRNRPALGGIVSPSARYTNVDSQQSFDITAYVKEHLAASATIDLALVQDVLVGRKMYVYGLADATRRPYLEVVTHAFNNPIQDAIVSPSAADFDKYEGSVLYRDIEATVSLMGNRLTEIRNGSDVLTEGTDYTVLGNRYTIKKEYLRSMATGTLKLIFAFSDGADGELTIEIADTGPPEPDGDSDSQPVAPPADKAPYPVANGIMIEANGTTETSANGETVSRFAVGGDMLRKAAEWLEQGLREQTVIIRHGGAAAEWITEMPASALEQLKQAASDVVIAMETGVGAYRLPAQAIDLQALADTLQVKLEEVRLTVAIREISGTERRAIEQEAARDGVRLIANPVAFAVTAEAGGARHAIEQYDGIYVSRTINLSDGVEFGAMNGFLYDPERGLSFVPTVFEAVDGRSTAELKRSGNSIYLIGESVRTFADMSRHWAKEEVGAMASKLILQGVDDRRFAPERSVTRAEFAAMLVRGLALPAYDGAISYSDVGAGDWFAEAVGAASKAGIVSGYEDGMFRPDDTITREQMAVMLIRALAFAGGAVSGQSSLGTEQALASFEDASALADWSRAAAAAAASRNLMQGVTPSRFAPGGLATRAQAAVVLQRLLKQLDFID